MSCSLLIPLLIIISTFSLHLQQPLTHNSLPTPTISLANMINNELNRHNVYRQGHGVNNLTLDENLTTLAQDTANVFIKSCTINDDESGENITEGENIFVSSISLNIYASTPGMATFKWYNQIVMYNFNDPHYSQQTRHFTQIVWKQTTRVGFGIANDKTCGKTIVVALYSPKGNVQGKFQENVPRLLPGVNIFGKNDLI